MKNNDLTPWEKKEFDSLPKNRQPGYHLEERTVTALCKQGILGDKKRFLIEITQFRLAGALAVFTAIMIGMFTLGYRTKTFQDGSPFVFKDAELRIASSLQQAGTGYLAALESLEMSGKSGDTGDNNQVGEITMNFLYAVAEKTSLIMPDNLVVHRILQVLENEGNMYCSGVGDEERSRIIWF